MIKKRKWMYAPLRYDRAFKGFFTDKANDKFLKALIRHYLLVHVDKDDKVVFINTEFKPTHMEDKLARTDLSFRLERASGEIFNLEMQVVEQMNLLNRVNYYNSKRYVEQLEAGQGYGKLNNTLTLVFTFHDVFQNDRYINNIVDFHLEEHIMMGQNRKRCFVELGKYMKHSDRYEKDLLAELLIAYEKEDFERLKKEGEFMTEAVENLYGFSQKQKDAYWDDMVKKFELDMLTNERGWEERGMEKGLQQASLDIAKNMLKNGLDKDTIARCTGLSLEEIEALA